MVYFLKLTSEFCLASSDDVTGRLIILVWLVGFVFILAWIFVIFVTPHLLKRLSIPNPHGLELTLLFQGFFDLLSLPLHFAFPIDEAIAEVQCPQAIDVQ